MVFDNRGKLVDFQATNLDSNYNDNDDNNDVKRMYNLVNLITGTNGLSSNDLLCDSIANSNNNKSRSLYGAAVQETPRAK
jgi:hypothetical protein